MAPTVAIADEFDADVVQALQSVLPGDARVIENALATGASNDADYLITWMIDIDERALDAVPRLRGIVKLNSGAAVIDGEACRERGISVELVESPALVSVAEHAVMLILAVFKRLQVAETRMRAGVMVDGVEPELTTQESYAYNWVGLERFEALYGKTIGLVGLGKIGLEVARRLNSFEVDVVYTKRNRLSPESEATYGVRYLPLKELLASSHCVSLHNRFYPETEKMMGAEEFALMPEGSFFVNTARGRLVDEEALAAALESGHLAGAALDVFQYEPLPMDSPLFTAPNVILTPHSAGIPIGISLVQEITGAGHRILETSST